MLKITLSVVREKWDNQRDGLADGVCGTELVRVAIVRPWEVDFKRYQSSLVAPTRI